MKVNQTLSLVLLMLFLTASIAGAKSPDRYDLAYAWDGDVKRVIEYREKLAALLGPAVDKQLKLVGRDQGYGVVATLNGTQEQARAAAEKNNVKLRRAGLKLAQPISNTSYFSLFNVSFAKGANLEALTKTYAHIKGSFSRPIADKLSIETIDFKNFMIVYRCWESKSVAARIASQQGDLLKGKNIAIAVIPAVDRPVVAGKSGSNLNPTAAAPRQVLSRAQESGLLQEVPKQGKEPPLVSGSAATNHWMDSFLEQQKKKSWMQQNVRTAWVAYDLTNETYLVNVNSQRPFQAASMIKPFVALAFFQLVDQGKLSYTPQSRQMMEAMIQHSSNEATNWFIRKVGGPAQCDAILKKQYGHLFKQLKIREYIPPGGRTYKNSAQPADYIQFLRALWHYQLPYSKEMLRVMALPGRDRILNGTELPQGTLVYNKTGTTGLLCGDMGILVPITKDGRKVPYAIVGVVERSSQPADYKQWMFTSGGAIRDFSSSVYEEMKRKHNLL